MWKRFRQERNKRNNIDLYIGSCKLITLLFFITMFFDCFPLVSLVFLDIKPCSEYVRYFLSYINRTSNSLLFSFNIGY